MRTAVKEYLNLSDKEKAAIWEKAIFVFDTNVLLNLYRYTATTRSALLDSIKKVNNRIWIPYQVAYEFMKDRPTVIFDTVQRYNELIKEGDRFIDNLQNNLRLPSDDQCVNELHNNINKWINERKEKDLSVVNPSEDPLLNEILTFFDNRVGKKPSEEEKEERIKEGKKRYEKKIPPGYKDCEKSKRGDDSEYGDYFAWKEILEYSKENKVDIIYITNDQKEDWWSIVKGKTLGPRVELIKEFYDETEQKILFYTTENFIKHTQEKGTSIPEEVFNEIKTTAPTFPKDSLYPERPNTSSIENAILEYDKKIDEYTKFIRHKQLLIRDLQDAYERTHNPDIYERIKHTIGKTNHLMKHLNHLYKERDKMAFDLKHYLYNQD